MTETVRYISPNGEGGEILTPETAVSIEREGPVATVRMHTEGSTVPPYSIARSIWKGLGIAFNEISQETDSRIVILRGARPFFGTGADFHELLGVLNEDQENGDQNAAATYWAMVHETHSAIESCPKPVIAVIERYALGAAFALSMACDIRVAGHNAQVGIPAAQRGLTLGLPDTQRLVGKLGGACASELLILGKTYTAEEAQRLGIVNFVAEKHGLEDEVERLTAEIAKNAPLAMKEAKANIETSMQNPGLQGEYDPGRPIAWARSRDLREGITAFLEKRDPVFEGL